MFHNHVFKTATKKRTIYWLDGKREVVHGENLDDALTKAGYSQGALPAIDFVADGDVDTYIWKNGKWVKKAEEQ